MDSRDRNFFTGNEAIDNQHKRIFGLLQELNEAVEMRKGLEETGRILATLSMFVVAHFRMEEALMTEADLPGLDLHQADHAFIRGQVETLVDRFHEGDLVPADLAAFLTDWIDRHIANFDEPMAQLLALRVA